MDAPDPIARLGELLVRRRGVDLAPYKDRILARRIAVRVRALALPSLESYVEHAERHPDELDALLAALTINVTGWFRDAEVFAAIADEVLPRLLERLRHDGRPFATVWCAGCATGEEVWSVLIACAEKLGHLPPLRVLGTDLDRASIQKARKGLFEKQRLADLSPHRVARWFVSAPGGAYRMHPDLAPLAAFRFENLFDEVHHPPYDLVVCRNVMIYFTLERQRALVERFARALRPGGYLVLGRVERVPGGVHARYDAVNVRERIYRLGPREAD